MTDRFQIPFLQVVGAGLLLRTFGARISHSYKQATAECTIRCHKTLPKAIKKWTVISVTCGNSAASARLWFQGYAITFNYTMYPGEIALICRGKLIKASAISPSAPGGVDLRNLTDTQIASLLLTQSGIPVADQNILGTGITLGSTADPGDSRFLWPENLSARRVLDSLDAVGMGYRTLDTPGGTVERVYATSSVASTSKASFVEGVDLFSGSAAIEFKEPKNKITAKGKGVSFTTTYPTGGVVGDGTNTEDFFSSWIESELTGQPGFTAQDASRFKGHDLNRAMLKVSWSTWRDDYLKIGQTVDVIMPSCDITSAQKLFLQSIQVEIAQVGSWTMSLTAVSDLDPSSGNRDTGGTPPPYTPPDDTGGGGGPGDGGGGPGTAVDGDLTADFTVTLASRESIAGGAMAYDILCEDASSASTHSITGRVWTSTGGCSPSGSTIGPNQIRFITTVPNFATASITVTVTDSGGHSATKTKTLASLEVTTVGESISVRRLYIAASIIEAFDGTAWKPGGVGANVVGNGPIWANGGTVYRTADDFATPVLTSVPFGGGGVNSLWIEESVSPTNVIAGGAGGEIATSFDGGGTWLPGTPPSGDPILKVILSGTVGGEIHALTANGWYISNDNGATWRLVAAVTGCNDLTLSHTRNAIGHTGGVTFVSGPEGTIVEADFLGTPPNIVAIIGDIRDDAFYGIADTGETWVTGGPGSTTFIPASSIPATAQPRGLYRDGAMVGMLYFAGGDGVYKSLDAFASSGGYKQIHAAAGCSMIGSGELVTAPTGKGRLFAMRQDGLFVRSVDGVWVKMPPPASDASYINSGKCIGIPNNPDGIVIINGAGLWQSLDFGTTWTGPLAPPFDPAGVVRVCRTPAGIYLGSWDGIFHSFDASAWTLLVPIGGTGGTADTPPTWIAPSSDRLWWVSRDNPLGGLLNGLHWKLMPGDGADDEMDTFHRYIGGGFGIVSGPSCVSRAWVIYGDAPLIRVGTTLGVREDLNPITSGSGILDIIAQDNNILTILCADGIWTSSDGGDTATQTASFTASASLAGGKSMAFDPNNLNRIVVAGSDGFWVSLDRGASFTFESVPATLFQRAPLDISFCG